MPKSAAQVWPGFRIRGAVFEQERVDIGARSRVRAEKLYVTRTRTIRESFGVAA